MKQEYSQSDGNNIVIDQRGSTRREIKDSILRPLPSDSRTRKVIEISETLSLDLQTRGEVYCTHPGKWVSLNCSCFNLSHPFPRAHEG